MLHLLLVFLVSRLEYHGEIYNLLLGRINLFYIIIDEVQAFGGQ